MKKKNNYFLNLHNGLLEGKITLLNGLCSLVRSNEEIFELFRPSEEEMSILGRDDLSMAYWASGLRYTDDDDKKATLYTPLRQTIVLFCHEILNS